jgi:hypothetical protein
MMAANMDEMDLLVVDFRLSSVVVFAYQVLSWPIILLRKVTEDLRSSKNHHFMRCLRRLDNQEKTEEEEKSCALERHSSRIA